MHTARQKDKQWHPSIGEDTKCESSSRFSIRRRELTVRARKEVTQATTTKGRKHFLGPVHSSFLTKRPSPVRLSNHKHSFFQSRGNPGTQTPTPSSKNKLLQFEAERIKDKRDMKKSHNYEIHQSQRSNSTHIYVLHIIHVCFYIALWEIISFHKQSLNSLKQKSKQQTLQISSLCQSFYIAWKLEGLF